MSLSSVLANSTFVMQHTDTQYLGKGFTITSDAAQKASFEDLGFELQSIFHRCKDENGSLNTANKILITLGLIASKQGTPGEKAHFEMIKVIAIQALSQAQISDMKSRAEYFQAKLTIILFAKKLMTIAGMEAQAGIISEDAESKCLTVFKKESQSIRGNTLNQSMNYSLPSEDLSSFALSKILRISELCRTEGGAKGRPLTNEELLELESYCNHEDVHIKKAANDYTLLRKARASSKFQGKSIKEMNSLYDIGRRNMLVYCENKIHQSSQQLSPYYQAFDKFMDFLNTIDKVLSLDQLNEQKRYYEEHLTQLPAVHFAYSYFYNELTVVCSLFPSKMASMRYKKAYEGYGGNVLPSPEDFQSIEAVFTEPVVPTTVVEEKKEVVSKQQPANNKKPKKSKKKQPSRIVTIKHSSSSSLSSSTSSSSSSSPSSSTSSSSNSSPSSSTSKTTQVKVVVKLEKDSLPFDEIDYDPRVSLWFTNPEDCLALPSYANLSDDTKKIAVNKHAFPIALDQLVGTAYCVQEPYQNSTQQTQVDTLFSIPGEIENINSGKKIRGLFQYCISGKDKVCYHHYFKEMSTSELLNTDQYSKVFEEAEFPPLSSQAASTTPTKKNPDQELVYEPHSNTYAVTDKTKGLIFRAFKIRTLT